MGRQDLALGGFGVSARTILNPLRKSPGCSSARVRRAFSSTGTITLLHSPRCSRAISGMLPNKRSASTWAHRRGSAPPRPAHSFRLAPPRLPAGPAHSSRLAPPPPTPPGWPRPRPLLQAGPAHSSQLAPPLPQHPPPPTPPQARSHLTQEPRLLQVEKTAQEQL